MNNSLEEINNIVEDNSLRLENISKNILDKYTGDLDYCIKAIQQSLQTNDNLPLSEIQRQLMNIGPLLYFTLSGVEKLGLKEDISTQLRLEVYNKARMEATGTIDDKKSFGEEKSKEETLINNMYKRIYKEAKAKCDLGMEIMSSLKKIISARMQEIDLSRIQLNSGGEGYIENIRNSSEEE